jgi:hypothetical protein
MQKKNPTKKGFQPLRLFRDIHFEKYNFLILFFGWARLSITCLDQKTQLALKRNLHIIFVIRKIVNHIFSYQKMVQVK